MWRQNNLGHIVVAKLIMMMTKTSVVGGNGDMYKLVEFFSMS